jgi:hypothetical protein
VQDRLELQRACDANGAAGARRHAVHRRAQDRARRAAPARDGDALEKLGEACSAAASEEGTAAELVMAHARAWRLGAEGDRRSCSPSAPRS